MRRILAAIAMIAMTTHAFSQQGQPGAHFIENWDLNGDGSVSLEDVTTRRGDVFLTFDADENGFLDAEEYTLFDEAREADMQGNDGHGQGNGMRRAAEGMTLAFNDSDGDGQVSRDEFLGHSEDWIALMDRDGDGVITTADFGRN